MPSLNNPHLSVMYTFYLPLYQTSTIPVSVITILRMSVCCAFIGNVPKNWLLGCYYCLSSTLQHCRATASHQTYFEEIRQLFFRDEYSLLAEKWNAQRAQAVAHALLKVLYPLMEKELRAKLLTEAKEHVLQVSLSSVQYCVAMHLLAAHITRV